MTSRNLMDRTILKAAIIILNETPGNVIGYTECGQTVQAITKVVRHLEKQEVQQ